MPARDFYDQQLLDRFRPRLFYDRQYDYRATAAETMVANPGNLLRRRDGDVVARVDGEPPLSLELLCDDYPGGLPREATDCLCAAPDHPGDARRMERRFAERVYGRCVEDGGRVWLQYWLWFYYNPKNLFGFGKHEGDWEMVQLGLGSDGQPEKATYAQHDHGEARACRDDAVAFDRADGEAHPHVYVAPLSHASYFEARTHLYLVGIDHPSGDGPAPMPPVVEFGAWRDWPGRWGNSERVLLGKLGDGPPSPACQGRKWSSPGSWHDAVARRRLRVAGGRLAHRVGASTAPPPPRIGARRTGSCLYVSYALGGHGARRGRHLYVTVHDGDHVIESRTVRDAGPTGEEVLMIPDAPARVTVYASAFNWLRQRSLLASTPSAA